MPFSPLARPQPRRRLVWLGPALFALLGLGALAPTGRAEEPSMANAAHPVRLVSHLSLSPDGETLVYGWRGDLWQVPVAGGSARRLTFHPARDAEPRVSRDGRRVAFVSNRDGPDAVYVMPFGGGTPRPVTRHTEGFALQGWHPNGDALLVRARHDHHWRHAERFYLRSLDPERGLELVFDAYGGTATYSPDGRFIAFTREGTAWWRKQYRGSQAAQVWLYDTKDASFRKLTAGDHAERSPMWAPDGRHLYVVSEEEGAFNLVEIDLESDVRKSLTEFRDDGVLFPSISADGSTIVFRRLFDLYRVHPGSGNPPERIDVHHDGDPTVDPILRRSLTKATECAFTDDAREIAFIAGGDVWVMDTELKEPRRITDTPWPEWGIVFSPDFSGLYYVSAENGRPDVVRARRSDPEKYWWQSAAFEFDRITDDADTEWALSFTPDGKRLAFISGRGSLVTVQPDGSEAIRIVEGWDSPWYAFSPDGAWVAYAVDDENFNSDIWIRPADGTGTPFNVSRHPDSDGNPAWSPDGRILAWSGRRWREETDVCYVWLKKEDEEVGKRDRTLEKALEKMKGRKKKGAAAKKAASGATKKPEGGSGAEPTHERGPVAGTWRGRIQGDPPVPPEGLGLVFVIHSAEDGGLDGRIEVAGLFEGDAGALTWDAGAAKLSFSTTTEIGNLTGEGTVEGERLTGIWSVEGFAHGTFELERDPRRAAPNGSAEAGPAAPEATKPKKAEPKPVEIDFEGLEDRIHRIAISNSTERSLLWSPNGKTLAFRATVGGTSGLYSVTVPDGLRPKRLSTTVGDAGRWLKEGNQIAWLASGVPALMSAAGKSRSFSFRVHQRVDVAARHAAAFDEAWRIMRDSFYDARMNNRDWDAIREKYRPMAAAAQTAAELDTTVDMMLGELNASHLGFSASSSRWSRPGWRDVTGHLGVRLDSAYEGPGVRVADVVRGTPAWEEEHRLQVGDVIHSIDGVAATRANWTRLLTGMEPRDVDVEFSRDGGDPAVLTMRPTTYARVRLHLYDEWLRDRRRMVGEQSEGRLGYLHVRGMNWSSFERFEEELYKVGHGKDGLVIDVRDNGGGFTSDHLLTALTQPRHAYTIPRGGSPGYPQDRSIYASWWKPIVVLCNQNSFSNAEIFAHAIKSLGRGAIVGVPTAGGVLSTGGTTVMDVGSIRLPFRGWFAIGDGEDMERNGCVPDHVVWPQPADDARGLDRQLDRAVEVLREAVEAARADAPPPPRFAAERKAPSHD